MAAVASGTTNYFDSQELDQALHASVLERRGAIEEQMAAEDAKKREQHYEHLNSLGK